MIESDRYEDNYPPTPTPRLTHWARVLYQAGILALAGGIALQVFLAGAGALVHPRYWIVHRTFGHYVEYLAIALFLVGVVGRLPWRFQGLNGLMIGLFFMQYVFLYVMPAIGAPLLRALHAVNALGMFWLAVTLRRWAKRWAHEPVRRPIQARAR